MTGFSEIARALDKDYDFVEEHLPKKASSLRRNGCGIVIFFILAFPSIIFALLKQDEFIIASAILFSALFVICIRKYNRICKEAKIARNTAKQQEIEFRNSAQQNLTLIRQDTTAMGSSLASLSEDVRKIYKEALTRSVAQVDEPGTRCDFFICHASEDKDDIVRGLADELRHLGAEVFYDEYSLKVGDNLSASLDRGLGSSSFGIVVLSEHFFRRRWTARELGGLVALETAGRIRILPIWHKVSKDEVLAFSPTIADKVALNTANLTAKEMAIDLYSLLKK